ncbi:hypothetical protein ACOMHN_030187 [Nucella lapillus]
MTSHFQLPVTLIKKEAPEVVITEDSCKGEDDDKASEKADDPPSFRIEFDLVDHPGTVKKESDPQEEGVYAGVTVTEKERDVEREDAESVKGEAGGRGGAVVVKTPHPPPHHHHRHEEEEDSMTFGIGDGEEPSSEQEEQEHCLSEDTATTDVSMAAREQEEHIQEAAQSTPSQKSAGGRGKGRKKTKQSGLTEAQKEEVLEFLKERPHLYNKSHKDFKDQAKRNRDWKELAERLGVEAAACIGWYRSMRTMLARAKKAKSKSGSGSANLPRSLQWVWDHMAFMTPYMSSLSSDSMGPRKRSCAAVDPIETEADFDPDQPGPSRKVPRQAAASATPPAPAAPSVRPVGFSSRAAAAASESNCCGHLCTQLDNMIQRLSSPQAQFWSNIQWRVDHFDSNQMLRLQNDVWDLVSRHLAMVGPKPTHQNRHVSTAAYQPAVGVSGGGFGAPQNVASHATQQPVAGFLPAEHRQSDFVPHATALTQEDQHT